MLRPIILTMHLNHVFSLATMPTRVKLRRKSLYSTWLSGWMKSWLLDLGFSTE
ncbi:hypothetical protein BofuT4_uP002160.1 [Botrytis cinerea T4]|uniref:Uncharacterized protein n=1 Tax=Botryotinia fuckeliana (strain T4) TaxID=999810 RepID=G2YMC1_BOTF4|nr:hypothetical protein BofuT4_uP002160.1 [Botrytis cinerea T4]